MIAAHRQNMNSAWQQTRFIAYLTYSAHTDPARRETIENFLPLDGDPTAAERAAMKTKARAQRMEAAKKLMEEYQDYARKQKEEKENAERR